MNEEKHKVVMDALADLIRSELDSTSRSRFASVQRMAVLGQKLQLEMHPRPEDAEEGYDEHMGDIDGGIIARPRRAMRMVGGGDQMQLVHEMMAMAQPLLEGNKQQVIAAQRASEASELRDLIETVKMFPEGDPSMEAVRQRICSLMADIKSVQPTTVEDYLKEGDEDGLHMVPAVDVRRHQAGQDGPIIDADHDERPFADREGGDDAALREGDGPRGVEDPLGY